jgi:iron complex outermembrane receptor protein
MSRKSGRNVPKNTAKAERAPALLRLPYSTVGLSSLALGSMAIAGAVHARQAPAADGANAVKPKAAPGAQQAKSLRSKVIRVAASDALPANGAGLLAQNSAAAAQPQTTALPAASSANTLQEIVVTGIRGSLQRSLEIKRMSIGVVDAVSAEDIGQFPDASIGAAVGRIPGVTVNRGSINQTSAAGAATATGSVTGVTIRGFGDQFNELLVEGRQLASGNGQNFDFSTMSANYIGEIDVHKTPDFSLSSGAIGGTINVKFPNPFDNPGLHAQGFVSTTDFANDGAFRPAFGGLLSDTFDDGKFGILVDGDYTDHHILGHHQDIVGWKAAALPCSAFNQNYTTAFGSTGCGLLGAAAAAADKAAGSTTLAKVDSWYPQDMAMYLERTDSRRKDGRVAVQWHPTENVLVTLDDNYSSDDEHTDRFQRSTWFGVFPTNGPTNVTLDGNSTVTNFTDTGPTDFNSFVADDYIVTNTPGLNVMWEVNDDWTAELDADQSDSKLNPNGTYSDIDADVGFGSNDALGTNNTSYGLVLNSSPNVLPYWSAYGPNAVGTGSGSAVAAANSNGLNPFIIGSHVLPLQTQENSDKINEVKLDATWHRDGAKVHFGAQFMDDLWNSKIMDTFTNNYWQLWSGYGPANNSIEYYCPNPGGSPKACASQTNPGAGATLVTHGVALPASMFSAVNLGTWMPGFNGQGNLPSSLLMYNPYSVLNYLMTQPINADFSPSGGYPAYTGGVPQEALNPSTVQHVDRTTYSPFVTAEQNFPVGDMTLKADVGLRWERTDEQIAGLVTPLQSLTLQPSDPTAYNFNYGSSTWTVKDFSYSYFLPSLDLNLLVRPDLKVRADFSRTESAPQNNQLIPNTTFNGRVNSLNATGNNPELLPYLSDNFDLGAEWYYGSNDYVSVDGFFKHVTQFPVSSVQTITVPGVIDPSQKSSNFGNLAKFSESTVVNGLAANVKGVEVTWQQMLLYGFGYQVNGTYAHSSANFNSYVTTANQFALPGVGNSVNFVGFYQRHGLQARVTVQWQGDELIGAGQIGTGQEQSGGDYAPEPVYLASSTEVDFSTQYALTHNLNVYFEALNLTDAVYHTYGRFSNQTLNLVDYGRSYTMGVRAKF